MHVQVVDIFSILLDRDIQSSRCHVRMVNSLTPSVHRHEKKNSHLDFMLGQKPTHYLP